MNLFLSDTSQPEHYDCEVDYIPNVMKVALASNNETSRNNVHNHLGCVYKLKSMRQITFQSTFTVEPDFLRSLKIVSHFWKTVSGTHSVPPLVLLRGTDFEK